MCIVFVYFSQCCFIALMFFFVLSCSTFFKYLHGMDGRNWLSHFKCVVHTHALSLEHCIICSFVILFVFDINYIHLLLSLQWSSVWIFVFRLNVANTIDFISSHVFVVVVCNFIRNDYVCMAPFYRNEAFELEELNNRFQ